MEQHYILCGLGRVGWRVLAHLRAAGARVVAIDNCCRPDDPRLQGVPLVVGDCRTRETLERANVTQARGVLIVTSDDLTNLSTTLLVRNLHPTVRVVVRMFNENLIARLGAAVSNVYALSTSALAGPLLALIARTGEALGAFRLEDGRRLQVADFTIDPQSPLVGRPVGDVAREHHALLVAHCPAGQPLRFLHAVDPATPLAPDDQLVVCGPPRELAPLLASGENESLPELLWAGLVRRLGRVALRGLVLIDPPVKICTAALVSVIAVSVLVFHLGMEKDTLVDAFYRTVSLMATGADMHGDDFAPGAWQKAYISSLRLVGLILTAAFTAIFTNYLIRANLGGALEVRRIPDRGHILVCGLGNVGFRVAEELHGQGEPVVVIERRPDNPFIPTVRRLGIPVIVGDATLAEVLKQAHAAQARAVVAATSHDLSNLEIALLVRELDARQRVIVRLTDESLAQTLRQAANVRLALSIPELAAPAFVARLFGDRVRSLFMVEGRLLVVYDLRIPADDALLHGRTVAELAGEFRLLPVSRHGPDGTERPIQAEKLEAGERLTAIIALDDLQRLLHRAQDDERGAALAPGSPPP